MWRLVSSYSAGVFCGGIRQGLDNDSGCSHVRHVTAGWQCYLRVCMSVCKSEGASAAAAPLLVS
jgi:hypothetical protein